MTLAGESLLITGFPGFYARRLAFHLLQAEPTVRLVLLRKKSDAERSAECLAALVPDARARVTELEGDPASLDFGLAGRDYLSLAESVQRVFHFANVLEAKRRAEAAAQNIACARELVEFTPGRARAPRLGAVVQRQRVRHPHRLDP